MKTITTTLIMAIMLAGTGLKAQNKVNNVTAVEAKKMYLIEREIPDAGLLTSEQLKAISQKSCSVLKGMNGIEWVHSYVTGNKIFCVYKAENEELIREHGQLGGFPVNKITLITTTISPSTAQ